MRWTRKRKPKPCLGDERYVFGFLVFPKCLNDEWRWLERATWVERVVECTTCIPGTRTVIKYLDWRGIRWANPVQKVS